MKMENLPFNAPQSALVDVFTDATGASVIGYRLGGFNSGPSLLVAGYAPVVAQTYDRLMALPTIGWMHGTLTLVFLDELESNGFRAFLNTEVMHAPDELLFLPAQTEAAYQSAAADQGYWSVLRTCTRLGMISGRGVV